MSEASVLTTDEAFGRLRQIALLAAGSLDDRQRSRELLIRLLPDIEQTANLLQLRPIIDSLLHEHGLFPYVEGDDLSLREAIALEAHRPLAFPNRDIVFHEIQARVYRSLLERQSVVLSAPTSFGKTLILDAIVASRRFHNLVVIVSTIALIDEVRRRLAQYQLYKIITHPSQEPADRNIFVMTQERLLETVTLPRIDFFMIDEFYKLSLETDDQDRAVLLNQALALTHLKGPRSGSLPHGERSA